MLSPSPDNKTKVDTTEETSVQTTKQLSSTLSIGALFSAFGSVVQKCGKTIIQVSFSFLLEFKRESFPMSDQLIF